jgi:hypothetical protein
VSDFPDLTRKGSDIPFLAQAALNDPAVMLQILDGIASATRNANLRANSSEALQLLSRTNPHELLPHWDYFVGLLSSGNGFAQYPAIHILANLAPADRDGRFSQAFDLFYNLLEGESVMIAGHVAAVSGQIAQAQPHLRSQIVQRLLTAPLAGLEAPRRELVRGYIVEALDACMTDASDRGPILAFVGQLQKAGSPGARKKATAFLKKWGGGS